LTKESSFANQLKLIGGGFLSHSFLTILRKLEALDEGEDPVAFLRISTTSEF
jgi:hypothetical protein